jgi:hypothetical protein
MDGSDSQLDEFYFTTDEKKIFRPAGALVSSPYSTHSTECPKGSPLGQGC